MAERPILIVEDDLEAQELLAELLIRRGYSVVTRSNGREALVYLEQGARPRLILLDLHMPMMDGYELHDRLVACEELANVPVVLMADSRSVDRSKVGSAQMLSKPLHVRELLAMVAEAS